jgi:hydrogenase maturation factor HypE
MLLNVHYRHFSFFSQDERPKIKLQNATLSVADVAKVIGEKWRSAPDDLKRRYEKAAKEAKERYEIELQAYKQTASYAQSLQQTQPKARA